ncbi:hypothetical protein ACFL7E_04145 [Thermodesulfobacteriota bacterium]
MKKLVLVCFASIILVLTGCAANTVNKKHDSSLKYSKDGEEIEMSIDEPKEVHRFYLWW